MNASGAMLALKLVLVPGFLLLVTLAARRWGPALAGWLAGLPVVTGPILMFVAIEQGPLFAAKAAAAALSAVLSTVAVTVVYSHAARHVRWPLALALAFSAWAIAAWLLSVVPDSLGLAAGLAALALLVAPRLFPPGGGASTARPGGGHGELVLRMLAGALLTLGVTQAAAAAGPRWSGLLAVFPVMSVVLAGFSHRAQGAAYTATLLRALTAGLSSFAMFCLVAALLLPQVGLAVAFAAAVAAALATQAATMRRRPRS